MHAPGVTVCAPREVAFDDVLLVPSAVLGAIGKGWAVMLTALGFARASHPSPRGRARSATQSGKIGACDEA
jgi:alkylation response protein AidB-like acyl-CoA dehydrogenase